MQTKLAFGTKVQIDFYDPKGRNSNYFESSEEAQRWKPDILLARGYFIAETKNYYYLAQIDNGGVYSKILLIYKGSAIGAPAEVVDDKLSREISYTDTQITAIDVPMTVERVLAKGDPPITKAFGWVVYDNKENLALGLEKTSENTFRTYSIIPKGFIRE